MPRRIRTKAKARAAQPQPIEEVTPAPSDTETLEDTDEFLDEVDDLLEENALEVMRSYVQRGGQAVQVFLDDLSRGLLSFPTLPVLLSHALRKA